MIVVLIPPLNCKFWHQEEINDIKSGKYPGINMQLLQNFKNNYKEHADNPYWAQFVTRKDKVQPQAGAAAGVQPNPVGPEEQKHEGKISSKANKSNNDQSELDI